MVLFLSGSIVYVLMAVSLLGLVLVGRLCWVLFQIHFPDSRNEPASLRKNKPIGTLIVLGSGGHTTEILALLETLDPKRYTPLTFVVATTDTTSIQRAKALGGRQADAIYKIPRSREVGQSYVTSIATTLWSLLYAIGLVVKIRPGLLLCNGPGTCLPIAIMTFVGRVMGAWEGQIVFVESFCRVTSLSLTGKLLYPIVDLFVVHWEQLHRMYPRSKLVTNFVPRTSKLVPLTQRMERS